MEKLLEVLNRNNPDIDYETETALITDGVLVSIDMLTLVFEFRNEFSVSLSAEDLTPENFDSAERILRLIESRRS